MGSVNSDVFPETFQIFTQKFMPLGTLKFKILVLSSFSKISEKTKNCYSYCILIYKALEPWVFFVHLHIEVCGLCEWGNLFLLCKNFSTFLDDI